MTKPSGVSLLLPQSVHGGDAHAGLGDSLLLLFVGWEGVGLLLRSHGFW